MSMYKLLVIDQKAYLDDSTQKKEQSSRIAVDFVAFSHKVVSILKKNQIN